MLHYISLSLSAIFAVMAVGIFISAFNAKVLGHYSDGRTFIQVKEFDKDRLWFVVFSGGVAFVAWASTWPSVTAEGCCWLWTTVTIFGTVSGMFTEEGGVAGTFAIATVVLVISSCSTDSSQQRRSEQERAKVVRDSADATPHVIRSLSNGCQEWAFKGSGYWHYSFICPHASGSTDSAHGVSHQCGKTTCTKTVYESSTFENP